MMAFTSQWPYCWWTWNIYLLSYCYKKRLADSSPRICPWIGTIDQTDCYQVPAHHQIQPFFSMSSRLFIYFSLIHVYPCSLSCLHFSIINRNRQQITWPRSPARLRYCCEWNMDLEILRAISATSSWAVADFKYFE
jgi:hypothetical protein